ncbi:hypothetical protein B566_EDAN014210 [Ephemera danica]|nr:hypothetical protein B566_EDAN014210 [Ephemera danica]
MALAKIFKSLQHQIFEIYNHIDENVPEIAKLSFTLHNVSKPSSRIYVPFRRKYQLNIDVILTYLERTMQSSESFLTDSELVANYDYIDIPIG